MKALQKKRFLINAGLLTATGLITRTIGVLFRVYISNRIGAQGVGIYQLILTVYFFATTFATSGITLAVTRLVTDSIATGKSYAVKSITGKFQAAGLFVSSLVALALFIFSDDIGVGFLNDTRTALAIRVLAPSLPFMAVSACYRGYFYARRTVMKTASEQLIEQIIEIAVFMAVSTPMISQGLDYACAALALATTLSEVVSSLYSYILYRLDVKKIAPSQSLSSARMPKLLSQALYIALPVTGSSCLRSGLSMIENVLIPIGLRKYGSASSQALADYGMITGMAMPIITFPAVFIASFAMLIIPEMSEAKASLSEKSISRMGTRLLQVTFMFTIPVAAVFIVYSKRLGELIYGNEQVGFFIGVIAPIIPLTYLDSVVDGMLKGLNEQVHYLTYNIIDSVVRVILTFTLIPGLGIKGVVAVMFVSAILNSGLSLLRLLKVAKLKINFTDWILKPVLCIFTSAVLFSLISSTVISIVLSLTGYCILMRLTNGLTSSDISWLQSVLGHTGQKPIKREL